MKREDMFGNVEILLFDILQELKKMNEPKEINKDIKEEIKQYPCKACGGVHENKGQLLSCARKYKKDGAK
jgi:hypothetical protein